MEVFQIEISIPIALSLSLKGFKEFSARFFGISVKVENGNKSLYLFDRFIRNYAVHFESLIDDRLVRSLVILFIAMYFLNILINFVTKAIYIHLKVIRFVLHIC